MQIKFLEIANTKFLKQPYILIFIFHNTIPLITNYIIYRNKKLK